MIPLHSNICRIGLYWLFILAAEVPAASKPAEEEEDLFGSDSEEEDPAVAAERKKNLEEYKAKKAAKGPKPAAKSMVTLEVKPWGMFKPFFYLLGPDLSTV